MAKPSCPVCGGSGTVTPKQKEVYEKNVENLCSMEALLKAKEGELVAIQKKGGVAMSNKELSDKVTLLLEEACSYRALIAEKDKELQTEKERADDVEKEFCLAKEMLELNIREIDEGTKTIAELKKAGENLSRSYDSLCVECSNLRHIIEKQNEELLIYKFDQGLSIPRTRRKNHFLEFFEKR